MRLAETRLAPAAAWVGRRTLPVYVLHAPLLALVTMRGEWGEFNPWQLPMGHSTPAALETAGVITKHVNDRSLVGETVFAAAMMAFQTNRAIAVLIGQRVVGFKDWSK